MVHSDELFWFLKNEQKHLDACANLKTTKNPVQIMDVLLWVAGGSLLASGFNQEQEKSEFSLIQVSSMWLPPVCQVTQLMTKSFKKGFFCY